MLDLKVIMGIGRLFVVSLMTFSVVKIGKINDNVNDNDDFFSFLNDNANFNDNDNVNLNPSLDDNLSTLTFNP
jgi:hypothetical protein